MNPPNYLPDVKAQYEHLPYPHVDPLDEHQRLMRTWLEDLPMMNHYCYAGKQDFSGQFRVLVAGGGTGDATIFLAEQLRATNARIVHLDLSEASIAIARERARIRGLHNIDWLRDSLLNLPGLGLAPFDYINCVGVLHHLADPDAGLHALESVLKPDGAIALMLYGAVGRTGIYHMQELLRLANGGCSEAEKITHAKEVLAGLPQSNWYRQAGDLYGVEMADAEIFDRLLHSQDRAYTVTELFEWLEDGHGFHLELSDVQRGRFPYLPQLTLGQDAHRLRARLPGLARRARYAMSELLIGDITRHNLYLTRTTQAMAPYGDADYIPFFYHEALDGKVLEALFAPKAGAQTMLRHEFLGMTAHFDAGNYSGRILGLVDGQRSFGQIFELLRAGAAAPDNAALFADFRQSYEVLNGIERLLLRHVSCR
ncbi:MAG: class I SAM-dependent methyltransferase [Pseudomonadota bacterium]